MPEKFCQSCAMPLEDPQLYGTNADGSKNEEYCKYCFENGKFTSECTMEEMIEICVPHMANADTGMDEKQARDMMREFFPKLKRWQ